MGLQAALKVPAILLSILALNAASAHAGARQDATILYSENAGERAFQEEYGYNDAIILADGTVYMSGVIVYLGPDETDLDGAYARAYARIESILMRAGANWDDVIDITSFHTDLTSQLKAMKREQRKYIDAPFPSWTAIQVSRLVPDRGITEIKIIAKISKKPND